MNDCFLNLLFSFQLLLPLKEGADFVGSKQTIDVILSDLSLLGYVRSEERRVGKECRSRWSPYH